MKLSTSVLCVFLASASASVTRAQCPVLTGPSGLADVDGDRAILSDAFPLSWPQVYFYAKRSDGWHQEQTTGVGNFFMVLYTAVAMDGDRAIAGSCESDQQRGRAYVFNRVGSQWSPTRLQPLDNQDSDFFGQSVDISGDIAIVGASHMNFGGGDGLRRVHVFEFDGSGWPETAQLPEYGDSIDVEGETVAIGNHHNPSGRVPIYRKVRGVWSWITELRSPAGPAEGSFGTAVALHGNRIAIGATNPRGPSHHGVVYVFEETTSGWREVQRLEGRQGFDGDGFGTSLSWSDSVLLVGAPGWTNPGIGSVHRFDEIGGRFVETGVLRAEPSSRSFGYCVAQSRGNAVVFGDPVSTFFRLGIEEATPFCAEPPNSTGFPGILAMEGCDSLAGRMLTLHASDLPAGTLARSFLGGRSSPVAFGDGYRCVGNPLFRLSAASADAAGEFRSAFDFDSPGGLELTPGSTWSFQVLYRDARSQLAGFNLTNAVAVGITP